MKALKFFVVIVVGGLIFFAISPSEGVNTFQYGRFTIEVDSGGHQAIRGGGKFIPPVRPLTDFGPGRHQIFVNYTTKELMYYRCKFTSGQLISCKPILGYVVVTPDPSFLPEDVIMGFVKKIDVQATSLKNEMGLAKFEIIWHVLERLEPDWLNVSLHGTAGEGQDAFWAEETLDGVRLMNEAMEDILISLGPAAVAGTENSGGIIVFLLRGDGTRSAQRAIAVSTVE